MVKGKVKQWTHGPSGRVFSNYEDFLKADKAWARRYGTKTQAQIDAARNEKLRLERERAAKDKLKKHIFEIEKEKGVWYGKRDEYAKFKHRELMQKISDDETQVKKLQLAVTLQKKALGHYLSETKKEWEDENPFPKEKELKNARAKLYRL